ncbi:MAG: magnesium transporter [Xylanivirga thermophila]|jgi:magnesium transporter|uniref:magnesium transporter n=1 Tax=Xylanivirga thermophila TaxID=2496273 RepID=UPI0039F6393C
MDLEKLKMLLEQKDYVKLVKELKDMQEADVAEFLDELDHKTALLVFRLLPKDMAADIFVHLSPQRQTDISMLVDEKELSSIVDALYFDDKIDFIEEMPAYVVKKILKNSTETERKIINQFLNYPENSAGSLMTIEFVDLKKYMHVWEALEKIRKTAQDKETIYTCYVIDAQRKLEGIVSLRDLVLADPEKKIEDIMETDIIYVKTSDDQEDVAEVFKKYDLLVMPVVDHEDRLVGIITIDDIVDVIEQENTEDFHRMAAMEPSDELYLDTSVFVLAKRRFVWLLVLMVSATISGAIIRKFEYALESVVALTVFIPMLMDTGGNAGSQSSTLVIRSLALGEISFGDTLKVLWKELRVSLLVGIPLGIINFLRIRFIEGYDMLLALTVSSTLVVTVIFAKLVGGVLPILAKKMKIDPAIMASPLITTIVDALSLIFYFTFAHMILGL